MNFIFSFNNAGNDHAPAPHSVTVEAESEAQAREKFTLLGFHASDVVVSEIVH